MYEEFLFLAVAALFIAKQNISGREKQRKIIYVKLI